MEKLKKFISANKTEVISITLLVLITLALRLFKISEYLTFLGDEGRDVRVVRDLITKRDLIFIGPQTSIGNMYLGPLYYYMMAPFLWAWNLNPTGPAVMVALLSGVTTAFIWYVGRSWFGPLAGILAALLFTISPVTIIYGRTSWNPNPMPFFALLSIWGIYKVWQERSFRWLPVTSIALVFALQMHYLGLLLIPTLGLFWLLTAKSIWSTDLKKPFIKSTLISILFFILLMSPLALFDLKHDGMNFNAFKSFFTNRQTTININPANSNRFLPVLYNLTDDLILGSTTLPYLNIIAIAFLVYNLAMIFHQKTRKPYRFLLYIWIAFGWLGLSVYKQHVYAHYFGFLFPAFALLVGFLLSRLYKSHSYTKPIAVILLGLLIYLNLSNSPLKQTPNNQLARTEEVVDLIIEKSNEEEFNFALIAKQNYDESYRYFLENKEAQMVRGEDHLTDQLFVVCEDGDKCQPEGNPQYQVAIFGPSHVVDEYQIDHIKIYRLERSNL